MIEQKKVVIALIVIFMISCSIRAWFYITKEDTLPDVIRIASGPKGGEYYRFGNELKKKLESRTNRPVRNIESAGTMENLQLMKEGAAELALLQSIIFPDSDDTSKSVSIIAPIYIEPTVILARKEANIHSVYNLEDKRVCTGPEGSGTAITSDMLLKFYGLKNLRKVPDLFHNDLNGNDKKHCDAGIVVMGLNSPGFEKISKADVTILELPMVRALAESESFLVEFTIPEGILARHPSPTLPHKDIKTIAYTALLAVNKEKEKEKIFSTLVEETLNAVYRSDIRRSLPNILPLNKVRNWSKLPLHLSAQEYYNPLRGMENFTNRMESYAAIKELFFAFLAISYFIWLRFHELRKREDRELVRQMKEKLDEFLQETMTFDQQQGESESAEELQDIIARITELKIHALQELTHERLRSDQMFIIFLTQCHNVICKAQNKILISNQSGK